MGKCTALLYMCIYMVVTETKELYPPSWEPFCDVFNSTEFVNITCNLKVEDTERLKLKDLNTYTNNTADNVKYSVYWKCSPNASVSISLPMQINKIFILRVSGCRIYDYFADWNDQSLSSIKDSLAYEEMSDNIIMFDLIQLLLIIDNFKNVSNDWKCGQDTTIKQSINKNISSDIVEPSMEELMPYIENEQFFKNLLNLLNLNTTGIPEQFLWSNTQYLIQKYDPECNFQNLEVLKEVMSESLHIQNLVIIFKSVDRKYPNMRVFNFSHNGFKRFPEEWNENIHKFPKLEYIDYSYNFITDFTNVDGFSDSQPGRHVVLDLRYNNITSLTVETMSKWKDLQDITLDIRGNPFDCGCLKDDVIYKIQNSNFFDGQMRKYKYLQNMTCASPESARGIKIINLSKNEMGCEIPPVDFTMYLVALGVTAFVVILVMILLFTFRKEIKIILYVKFNILLPWDVDKSEKKRFDAFISYSSTDSDWVFDNIIYKLESPFDTPDALSLCIHERDFIAGKSILLNIIESIENSRHTIVVLSRQFIKSVWSMAEFKEAYEESVTKKRRHLIIIKYEDIPEEEMDSMLKRCIKTFTYINVKDPMFLNRLRYSLAIKSKQNPTESDT